ncbi:MAG: hypothetical protein ACI8RZ_007830 [Myxococcota bacterium]|jgi:hypothetical protein
MLSLLACTGSPTDTDTSAEPFVAMTFNIGTTTGLNHDDGDDGYTQAMSDHTDELYENSLSWNPAEDALIAFMVEQAPDVVVFQEMFFDPWCLDIPVDPTLDFVCQDYTADRPLQIQRLLGEGYQVACALDEEDNCAGIRRAFGTIEGCDEDVCLGGLDGMSPPSGCSNGAKVGTLDIATTDGRTLTLVNVHASSGINTEDTACRVDQLRQIFVDRGDGVPAAWGSTNLVMGDINTDPFQMADLDPSAAEWNTHVGDGLGFEYISSDEPDGEPTYSGLFRIDHVVSDTLTGDCTVPGETDGTDPVMEAVYWDHRPVVCNVR